MLSPLRTLTTVLVVGCCLAAVGCESSDPAGPGTTGTVITRTNARPDSLDGWMYYSFDGDTIVPADSAATGRWDLKLPFLTINSRTIDIELNSGTVGKGATTGLVVASRWENVTKVDAGWVFLQDDTLDANRVVPNCVLCPQAMFVYSGAPNHAITPSPDKVAIVKTPQGTIVKFQVTSIYQNAVPNPNTTTPIGYYHFRYVKAVNGSF